MKYWKCSLLIAVTVFLASPAHSADSDSDALRECMDLDDEMTVHYSCEESASLAFCYEDIVMKQHATDTDIRLAEDMHCQSGSGFHDPCHFYGPGKCHNIEMQAWARRIASYTVVYGICPRAGNHPRWVGNPGSNGQYTCDPDPMGGVGSDDDSDGSAETLSEDDLYERLFGEYENSLSALLDGDLTSAEVLEMLLVELLGGELSFDDALGNMGQEQVAAIDLGNSPSATPTASEYERALDGLLGGSGYSTVVLGDNGAGQVVTGDQRSSPSATSSFSAFDCKSTYEPHSDAMNLATNRLEAANAMDLAAKACATANGLRVGIWFMENCNKSSLSQTEIRQVAAQIDSYRDALRQSISTYNAVNAGSSTCECQSDISNYCMD